MESPAQAGECAQVSRLGLQGVQGFARLGQHFAGFFDEDLAHVLVHQRCGRWGGGHWHQRGRRRGVFHDASHIGPGRIAASFVAGLVQRRTGTGGGIGQVGGISGHRLLRQAVERTGQVFMRRVGRAGGFGNAGQAGLQRRVHPGLSHPGGHRGAAHQRREAAGGGVEAEQGLGQFRLRTQHVDEEGQTTQVVGQTGRGRRGLGGGRLGLHQGVDVVAHAQHRLRGLVQAQH